VSGFGPVAAGPVAAVSADAIVVAATPIVAADVGAPYRYNQGYPTRYFLGDTFSFAWSDNNVDYSPSNDSRGFQGSTPTSNISFNSWSGSPPLNNIVGTLVNRMPQFGTTNQLGTDGASYKTGGLLSQGGTLYLWTSRHKYGSNANGNIQTANNAQLIKSTDKGVTWSPLPPSTANPFAAPMFTDTKFSTPWFVQYGKDGQVPDVHNSALYAYALSNNGSWNNGDSMVIGRCLRSALPNLSAADWSFYQGGDGMLDASWGALATAATIVNDPKKVAANGAQYIPATGRYVMFQWHYPFVVAAQDNVYGGPDPKTGNTVWSVYESPTPWGPWTKIQTIKWNLLGVYNGNVIPRSVSVDGGSNIVVAASGDYGESGATEGYYTLIQIPVALRTTGALPAEPVCTADPVITGLIKPGEVVTCSPGTWTNSPHSFLYQWRNQAGQWLYLSNKPTYLQHPGDGIPQCDVVAINAAGTSEIKRVSHLGQAEPADPSVIRVGFDLSRKAFPVVFSADYLTITQTGDGFQMTPTVYKSDGAWYGEMTVSQGPGIAIGFANTLSPLVQAYAGQDANSIGMYQDGYAGNNVIGYPALVGSYGAGAVIRWAMKPALGKVWLAVNGGAWNGDPVAGTGGLAIPVAGGVAPVAYTDAPGASVTANNGYVATTYAKPTGFSTLDSPATNKSLVAARGVVTVTGRPSNLVRGFQLAASRGTFTATGQAVGTSSARVLPAAPGAFVITGQAMTFRRSYALAASSTAVAFQGRAATLIVGKRLQLAAGSFALTGLAMTMNKLGALSVLAATGAFAMTGQAATFRTDRRLVADRRDVVLTGRAMTFRRGLKMTAAPGAFAFTGNATAFARVFFGVPPASMTIRLYDDGPRVVTLRDSGARSVTLF
jgi:hypothetical protein